MTNVNGYPGVRSGGAAEPGWRPDFPRPPGPPPGHFDPFYDWYFRQGVGDIREINRLREHLREIPFKAIKGATKRWPLFTFFWDFERRRRILFSRPGARLADPGSDWSRTNDCPDAIPTCYSTDLSPCCQDLGVCTPDQYPTFDQTKLTPSQAAAAFGFARWEQTDETLKFKDSWQRQVNTGQTLPYTAFTEFEVPVRERERDWKRDREPPFCIPGMTARFDGNGIGLVREGCEIRYSGRRDRKFIATLRGPLERLISRIGEAIELAECMYDALPGKAKPKRRPRGPQNRMKIVLEFMESANSAEMTAWVEAMLKCFLLNQLEDLFFGKIGQIGAQSIAGNPYYVRPVGFQTGQWAWPSVGSTPK